MAICEDKIDYEDSRFMYCYMTQPVKCVFEKAFTVGLIKSDGFNDKMDPLACLNRNLSR